MAKRQNSARSGKTRGGIIDTFRIRQYEARRGNGLEYLDELPAASVDLLLTDPPYGTTALAYDCKIDLDAFWAAARRVVRPLGVMVVFSAQAFTTAVINANRKEFRYEIIWAKDKPTGFLDANKRPLRAHENILIFTRERFVGSTYNPQFTAGKPYKSKGGGSAALYRKFTRKPHDNHGTRYPRSVQHFPGVTAGRIHPSEKPLDLFRWLVLTYSNPKDLVCDPYMGSGVCGQACLETGRRFFGVELDRNYFSLAKARLESSGGNGTTSAAA